MNIYETTANQICVLMSQGIRVTKALFKIKISVLSNPSKEKPVSLHIRLIELYVFMAFI